MYIYELPYLEFQACSEILDENDLWEELGKVHMKFDRSSIQDIRRVISRGKSPTEYLFTLWGNQNHTVLELFVLLSYMGNYDCMSILKKFVDPKYHILIKEGPHRLTNKLQEMQIKSPEDNNHLCVKPENFDKSEKILNVCNKTVEVDNNVSRENNESSAVEVPKPKSPNLAPYLGRNSRMLTAGDISSALESIGPIPQIPYEELQKSTNNWDESTILGKGGFGTVYKGTWKCTKVAIKQIGMKENNPESHFQQMKQSMTELHCLNAYRHDNVLPIYGYSIGGPQPCLVYQYMPGGCLDRRLRVRDPTKVLNWTTRLNIAIGTARGLQFLHTIGDKPLIHGDIKSANILLDLNDTPRIGDFGLAREGPDGEYTCISRIHGTRPYLPEEYLRSKEFSTKVDTYSFGVVLFELATGATAYSTRRSAKFLKDHVVDHEGDLMELMDPRADNGGELFQSLIRIGKMCVSKRAKDRPEMVQVLLELEEALS